MRCATSTSTCTSRLLKASESLGAVSAVSAGKEMSGTKALRPSGRESYVAAIWSPTRCSRASRNYNDGSGNDGDVLMPTGWAGFIRFSADQAPALDVRVVSHPKPQ